MKTEEERFFKAIQSVVNELKKKPYEGRWHQTIEDYSFDSEVDVRMTISVHPKPTTEYKRGLRIFGG